MDAENVHALTAAYALDALDEADEREYEEHLRGCAQCRAELRELTETAAALSYAVDTPAPPPALRERILDRARSERAVVVPLQPRRRLAWASTVAAAAAAVAAIGLGVWANSLSDSLDREREVTAILSDPDARAFPLAGVEGQLVRSATGRAALVVAGLQRAPSGKTYEIWVSDGTRPVRAGVFDAGGGRDVVALSENVPEGATVLVTIERDGGVDSPTTSPLFSAKT